MMKKVNLISIGLVILSSHALFAQEDAENHLKEAKTYIKAKNFKEARLAMQDALASLKSLTGKEILKVLPNEINGMKLLNKEDEHVNLSDYSYGDGGFNISRTYKKDKDTVSYITVTIYVTSIGANGIKNNLMTPSLLDPLKEKIIKLHNGKRVLMRRYTSYVDDQKSSELTLNIPYNEFYVAITGYGQEAMEESLIKYIAQINFDALKQLTNDK
jgi:hypothetical protein